MNPTFKHLTAPARGERITLANGKLNVPKNPIIPFIEGDGTGADIWRASQAVFDAAVAKAYKGDRKIEWFEVPAGEKSFQKLNDWLPEDTLTAMRHYLVSIKGPLSTPVGGGMRSLNVALRQMLDLYVCLRPVRWFKGVPSPVKQPSKVDMVIFRENTEDIYAGIEFEMGSEAAKKMLAFLKDRFPGRNGASGPFCDRLRDRESAEVGDDRSQGQHHEVHRGGVSQMGLRAR